jgi:hypothetical protein
MSLYGNRDLASGNQKPLYANTSNAYSSSTIVGDAVANTAKYYGNVVGISENEAGNTSGEGKRLAHAGWNSVKLGTGPVTNVVVLTAGTGINADGFLIITDAEKWGGGGSSANISFTFANTANDNINPATLPVNNGVATIAVVDGGSGFHNASSLSVKVSNAANTTQPTVTITLGGRAGRFSTETLVASGSFTDDDVRDDSYFPGT